MPAALTSTRSAPVDALELLAKADPRVLVRNRSTVVRLAYPHFANPDLAKWLHRIDVPTLLIWGANDGLVPVRLRRDISPACSQFRSGRNPRSGTRSVLRENSEVFLAAVTDFLQ